MSRAFTRESDTPEALPERAPGAHPNYVTPAGLAQLRARSAALRQELAAAQARTDAAAVQALARDLRWLDGRVADAIVIDGTTQPRDRVAFGAEVEVADASGAVRHWRIVGEDEADAGSGSVSWISPLARALAGARVGDEVLWPRPAGAQPLTVLAIRYPDTRTPR